jgi:hypothetical protein
MFVWTLRKMSCTMREKVINIPALEISKEAVKMYDLA